MSKISWGALFTAAFLLSVVPVFFFIRYGEERGSFDSIGSWYMVYSAVIIAYLFGAGVVLVAALAREIGRLWRG